MNQFNNLAKYLFFAHKFCYVLHLVRRRWNCA